jgi:hypothetical protein
MYQAYFNPNTAIRANHQAYLNPNTITRTNHQAYLNPNKSDDWFGWWCLD